MCNCRYAKEIKIHKIFYELSPSLLSTDPNRYSLWNFLLNGHKYFNVLTFFNRIFNFYAK